MPKLCKCAGLTGDQPLKRQAGSLTAVFLQRAVCQMQCPCHMSLWGFLKPLAQLLKIPTPWRKLIQIAILGICSQGEVVPSPELD